MITKRCRVFALLVLSFSFAAATPPAHADTPPTVDLAGLANALQGAGMNPSDLAGVTPTEAFAQITAAGIDPAQFGAPDPGKFIGTLPADQSVGAIFAARMAGFAGIAASNPDALAERMSDALSAGMFDSLGIDPAAINRDTLNSATPEHMSAAFASLLATKSLGMAEISDTLAGDFADGLPTPPLPFSVPQDALQVLVDPAGDGLFSFEVGHLPGRDGTLVMFNPSEAALNAVYDTMSGVRAEVIAAASSREGDVIVLSGTQEQTLEETDLNYASGMVKVTRNEPVDRTAFPNFGNESLWW